MKLTTPKTAADRKLVEEFFHNHSNLKLRVWHKPQIPCKSFEVKVRNLAEASLVLDTLAQYDLFQLAENIKPDFANAAGVIVKNNQTNEWEDYTYEDNDKGGHYFSSIEEMVEYLQENKFIPEVDWKLEPVS